MKNFKKFGKLRLFHEVALENYVSVLNDVYENIQMKLL